MTRFLESIQASAQRGGDTGIATVIGGRATDTSWGEIHDQALRLASNLVSEGLTPGDSVGLLIQDPTLTAIACQAVWTAGGSVTALHQPTARISIDEWAADLTASLAIVGASILMIDDAFVAAKGPVNQALPAVKVLPADTIASATDHQYNAPPSVGEDAVALRQLTSGSTGAAKAVLITHRNLHANLTAIKDRIKLSGDDTFVSWLPIFHDMGMVGFLTLPMMFGIQTVKTTPLDFVKDPLIWLRLITTYAGTVTSAPNFAYAVAGRRLARTSEVFDLSSLRVMMSGAEPIDPNTIEDFLDAAAPHGASRASFCAAAGMAEVGVASAFAINRGLAVDTVSAAALEGGQATPPAGPGEASVRLAMLGPPVPGIDVKVLDTAGHVLDERQVGELWFRGPSITPGYQTADGTIDIRDADGWIPTGDAGYIVDGEIVICGRTKDILIVRGRNLLPTEVERAAERAAGVRPGSAVAARLDAGQPGERFAVLVETASIDDETAVAKIRNDVNKHVADAVQARPHDVLVLPPGSIPKTTSGKVRRSSAAELYRTLESGQNSYDHATA